MAVNGLIRDALKEPLDRNLILVDCAGSDAPALKPEVNPVVSEVTF